MSSDELFSCKDDLWTHIIYPFSAGISSSDNATMGSGEGSMALQIPETELLKGVALDSLWKSDFSTVNPFYWIRESKSLQLVRNRKQLQIIFNT